MRTRTLAAVDLASPDRFGKVFLSFGLEAPASPRRRSRGTRLGLARCVGQALATEAIAECIRSGSVGEAESNIGLFCLVPTPAAADWDAPVTVERIDLWENTAKASRRNCEFDQMRKSRSFARPVISRLRRVISPNPPEGTARCTRNIMPIARDYSRASQSFLFARLTVTEA